MAIRRTPQCINKNSIAHVYFVLTKTLSVCFYPQVEKRSHFNHMMTVSVIFCFGSTTHLAAWDIAKLSVL